MRLNSSNFSNSSNSIGTMSNAAENSFEYSSSHDQAEGTGYHELTNSIGNGSDESAAGILHIFSPASTTYVKHFYAQSSTYQAGDNNTNWISDGTINVTAALIGISFKMESGNFDRVVQMYGIA